MAIKLLTVVDTFFPDGPGGMARVAWDVAKAMAARGHSVALLAGDGTARTRDGALREQLVDGVRVYRYPKPPRSPWDPWRARKQIADCMAAIHEVQRHFAARVIHCHSIFTTIAAATAATDLPLLQTVHSPAIQEIIYNWRQQGISGSVNRLLGTSAVRAMELQGLRGSTRLHALSEFTVAQMHREYPAVAADFSVIPHWADPAWYRTVPKLDARRRLGWPPHEKILFTVRQLRHRYGIDTAIEAIAPLANQGSCRFLIAGAGVARASLQSLIDRSSTNQAISLLGSLADEDLRLAYQAADLFILPTRELECFGLIILEALACGLPVIGTRVGAIPDNLSPILPGNLVPPDDPLAMRAKVEQFLNDELSIPTTEALIEYTRNRFGEERIVPRYEHLLERLCAP